MPKTTRRIPQVEGLRAVAAGAVFLTHLGQSSGFTSTNAVGPFFARLNVGVALFFVITGYLLYRPCVAARLEGRPGPPLGRYALRRTARILPGYWVALTVLALVLPGFVSGVFTSDWWVYFGLLQVYSSDWILQGLGVAWSLCTEVAFYALLPALGYAGVRTLGRRSQQGQMRIELLALAVSTVVAIVLLEVAHRADWGLTYPNTLLGKWPWFTVGMALAVCRAGWPDARWDAAPRLLRSARRSPWLWWLGAAAVLAISSLEAVLPREVFAMDHRDVMLETVMFAAFGALFVTPVVFGEPARAGSPAQILAVGPLVWLGTVSYGVFLWHRPIVLWLVDRQPDAPLLLTGVAALSITLLCAAVSWYLVERPFIALAHRRHAGAASAAIVDGMAEQNPTPLTVCVVCGTFVAADEAVLVPEHHEGGEIISTLVRHPGCPMPASDAGA